MLRSVVGVVVGVCLATSAHADAVFDKAAFTATPKDLLAVAKAAPTGDAPVVILRDEDTTSFDDQGRRTWRWRRVFVVRTQAGVDSWGTLGLSWSPFYQDKPAVRARVIDPDGSVTELDQKLITDAPQTSTSSSVFSDRRDLDAPLPRLRIGSIVEEEGTIVDRQPILAAGDMTITGVGHNVPTQSTRITISTPAHRGKLHASKLPSTLKPKYVISGNRETWTYDIGPLAPVEDEENNVPRDVVSHPYVGVTTTTWSAVARDYRKLVDKRIADGPFALPAELPKAPTVETVRAITRWLHQHVRYTGIEFGEASNIPWTPAETVKRGFGDCKDKATLLVAMLRQAGVRADLALLQTGPGVDTIVELPGMGVFDHAIVRARVGVQEVWIDATEDLRLPGELPSRDRGRRALVIADDTAALIDTPRSLPADNLIREVRTFELAERGRSKRAIEVSTEGGVFAGDQRAWIRDTRPDEVKKNLASYAESEYDAKLASYSSTPVDDLAKPFTVTVEMSDAKRAFTGRGQIDVWLYPADTLEKVSKALKSEPDKQRPRKADFEWYVPHVYEIENRLVVPPGYTMPAIQPEHIRQLGPARLIERQRTEGQTLVVTFRFETGKPRITAAELETMQKELAALAKENAHVVIEHAGWALAEAGKFKDAIAEVEKLIALHPKEALHHTQLAFVMIQAGMGTAARRAGKKAIEIEPASADAHAVLAWVLKHDTLGRELGFDHDRAGAIAELQKARKLDPKHVGAATDLGEMLERDARGVRITRPGELKEAIAARRAALALEDTDDNAIALARDLLYTRSYAELEALLRNRESSDLRDGLLIGAIAGGNGAKAGIEAAGRMRAGAAKTTLLVNAAASLLAVQEYDTARALFAETNVAPPSSVYGQLLAKIKRHDASYPDRDPRAPIADVIGIVVEPSYKLKYVWDVQTEKEVRDASRITDPKVQQVRAMGLAFFGDAMWGMLEPVVEGSGPWKLKIDVFGHQAAFFVALDKGVAKLIGSVDTPDGIGRHLFRLLARKDIAAAARLVDLWLVDQSSRAAAIWKASSRDKDAIALVAAIVASETEPAALPALATCNSTVATARADCDQALSFGYIAQGKWRELEQHTAEWLKRSPDSDAAKQARLRALVKLGRLDDAEKLATDQKFGSEISVAHARAEIDVARDKPDEALRRYDAVISKADPLVGNQVAWLAVVAEKDLQRALQIVTTVVGTDKTKARSGVLNTLAAVEAELGLLKEAKADGWQAIANRPTSTPDSADWYVVGRIAEQLDLRDDAIAAYRRVTLEPREEKRISAFALAQRRLQRMGITK